MFRSLLSRLRNRAFSRPASVTHCASCGELPAPLGKRLCVSVKPQWEADAVLLPEDDAAAGMPAGVTAMLANMPWLRRVHVPANVVKAPGAGILALPQGIMETDLPGLESLADYFIVFRPDCLPAIPLLPVDFFTPNGIPLLFVEPGTASGPPVFASGPFCRTKHLAALFAAAISASPAGPEHYARAFAQWAYAEQQGILALHPFTT